MIADYFIVRRMRYPEGFTGLVAVNWRAIVAFVVTLALNLYLGLGQKDVLWHSTPLIGFVVYLILSIPTMARTWRGDTNTSAAEASAATVGAAGQQGGA